jgi:hypothetical protein
MVSSRSDSSNEQKNDTPFTTRPLSRRASRLFLIAAFFLVVAGGVGMAMFVVDAAEGPGEESDSPPTEQVQPSDTTGEASATGLNG